MNTERKLLSSFTYPAVGTGLLLMIPLTAMQFTNEVDWTLSDFMIAGTLLFGTGLTFTLLTRKTGEIAYQFAIGFALFTGLFLIWVNMAVGIIGSENNDFNLLYSLVIFTGLCGGFISKFKPKGMMLTMFAMAITQALITIAALFYGMADTVGSSIFEIIAVNGFFITLFVVAASLFNYTAQTRSGS